MCFLDFFSSNPYSLHGAQLASFIPSQQSSFFYDDDDGDDYDDDDVTINAFVLFLLEYFWPPSLLFLIMVESTQVKTEQKHEL